MRLWQTVGCNGVISGGLENQGLEKGPPGVLTGWTALLNKEESLGPVFLCGHAVLQALPHASDKRGSWLVIGIAIDALGRREGIRHLSSLA